MTATTQKTGRVTKLADVKGLMEYRFVPRDWKAPLPHLMWFVFDPATHDDEYQKWHDDIQARSDRLRILNPDATWNYEVSWYKDGEPIYTARVDYHETERPVLVVVGGFQ